MNQPSQTFTYRKDSTPAFLQGRSSIRAGPTDKQAAQQLGKKNGLWNSLPVQSPQAFQQRPVQQRTSVAQQRNNVIAQRRPTYGNPKSPLLSSVSQQNSAPVRRYSMGQQQGAKSANKPTKPSPYGRPNGQGSQFRPGGGQGVKIAPFRRKSSNAPINVSRPGPSPPQPQPGLAGPGPQEVGQPQKMGGSGCLKKPGMVSWGAKKKVHFREVLTNMHNNEQEPVDFTEGHAYIYVKYGMKKVRNVDGPAQRQIF